jgi:hypothetical protein
VRAKTINQRLVHLEYMDQCYWDVDADTLLGHQMPISLVAMRPEVALSDIGSFWDWGITYDFCPSQRLTVLGDSDDFLMLELRAEAAHLDLVWVGPTTAEAAASRMLHITQYQIDVGRFPLTLHSRDLPPGAASAHAALQRFVDELSCYLRPKAKEHRDHPDWLYHKEHLKRYHEEGPTPGVHHSQTPIPLQTKARAEREAAVARIRELENQLDAMSQTVSAQVIELQTIARAEREAAVARIRELESQVDAISQAASAQVIELQTRAANAANAVLSSTSWRITAPLRAVMDRMNRLRRAFKSR